MTASSATVLQWFGYIERQLDLTLSYNPSLIDLHKTCRISASGQMTVSQLLALVLEGYRFRTTFIPPRKLAIQIHRPQTYCLSGSVAEEGSGERLYGAVVVLDDGKEGKWHALTDADGRFRLYLPEGYYRMNISYMGYQPYTQPVRVDRDRTLRPALTPQLFEIAEVTVKSYKNGGELGELTPSNLLSFSGNDLFSQIWILPGVTGLPTGCNFQLDGGSSDENQLLLDGVPVYHPGHINSLLPVFNGDAVRSMVFHKGFFPTRLEGRLSSVTEVNLKEGNLQEHVRTLTLDMPAAGITLEGPILKDKLSYLVSARRSWLDFFDNLLSEDSRMNHSTYDYNAKLSYHLSPSSTLRLMAQVGVHFVGYLPRHHRSYYSIQPRFSLKYQPAEKELLYLHFSRMEQFYHNLRFDYLSLPTDFRMPSIDGFRPRSSEHYEVGWKHFLENGQLDVSAYYKTRRHVVALSPDTSIEDARRDQYIMTGNGDSYGAKAYFYNTWKRWTLQLSYAYTRSREWFPRLEDRGKLPSLYDIPHQLGAALSCQIGRHSSLSLGGTVRSGRIIELDEFLDPLPANRFRTERERTRYRLDAGYSFRKDIGADKLLLLRLGLYNIVGNPSEEEVLSYYSVHWYGNCLPYASVSFKF
ncbi:MAG TPA: TonB-dependent receptor [Mediterranea massiliensis]|uniref:TonB-dependent receptor n=2 Tax=Mediterranea massiliensis TaxID=1841865 RepID=A0A921HWL8_9BACT|nr:TonB-dependent receptor [Mediterranea massiliensis]HJF92265.1 TonB-dependent receptor [Mediterranea massiliensis]